MARVLPICPVVVHRHKQTNGQSPTDLSRSSSPPQANKWPECPTDLSRSSSPPQANKWPERPTGLSRRNRFVLLSVLFNQPYPGKDNYTHVPFLCDFGRRISRYFGNLSCIFFSFYNTKWRDGQAEMVTISMT